MVLESLLAELLNRYIGDYVQNLDPKQLNLGIWGGDIKLSNLLLKESALNDLDLPFKVTHGRLSSLVLKIPWKNLYNSTVKVEVGGLYLVAVPNIGLQYNREKEEKDALEAKQRELRRLEDVKKLQKNAAGDAGAGQGDSFVEKMATQIIKNLQVDVTDIHIRFEDHFSNPLQPFACGVTLKKLQFVTTDHNWLDDDHIASAAKFVYKLVTLEALSMYWNPIVEPSASFHSMTNDQELTAAFSQHIASKDRKVPTLSYILEPIHFTCNLRINPKPELDESNFAVPKIDLRLTLESLALSLTRQQYEGVILFADALDTITLKSRYRKYGPPQHPIRRSNGREWWQYAQRCVLEGEVQPRLKGWSWTNIKAHRSKLKRYRYLYVQKLLNANTKQVHSAAAEEELEQMERELSTFNLVITRQQADADFQRLSTTLPAAQPVGWWGWMTGKGKGSGAPQMGEGDLEKKLAEIMTPEEKSKLYSAIGYREGAPIALYPTTFVENRFDVLLKELAVTFKDDRVRKEQSSQVLSLSLLNVRTQLEQRPSAEAMKLKLVCQDMRIMGTQDDNGPMVVPVAQDQQEAHVLLDVWYETKPLNSQKGFLVKVKAAPVRAVYDAQTIIALSAFFRPPRALQLKQLQVSAAAKFQELKESSTAGLRFALESRLGKEVELDVHLRASHLVIPENGVFSAAGAKLVVDLGDFRVRNIEENRALDQGTTDLAKLEASLYDKYSVALSNVQILFVPGSGKDNEAEWESARRTGAEQGMTPLHILQPLSCALEVHQCIVHDAKRPLLRVVGKLPSAAVDMTEARLMELSRLVLSIPLPESPPVEQVTSSQHTEAFKKDMERQAMSMARSNKDLKLAEEMFLSQSPDTTTTVVKSAQENATQDEGYQESTISSEGEAMVSDEAGDVFFDAEEEGSTAKRLKVHPSASVRSATLKNVNFTTLQLQFTIDDISLRIYRGSKVERPLLSLQLATIILELNQRTFDMQLGLALADLIIDYTPISNTTAPAIRMLQRHRQSEHQSRGFLLRMDYHKVDPSSPDFDSLHQRTAQRFNADFLGLDVVLDRQGLIELKHFAEQLQEQIAAIAPASSLVSPQPDSNDDKDLGYEDVPDTTAGETQAKEPVPETGIIDMDIRARCHYLTLSLLIQGRKELAYVALRDISTKIWMNNQQMQVQAQLKRIKLNYPLSADNLYPQIVRTLSDEVLSLHYTGYKQWNKQDAQGRDMDVQLSLGAVEVVFLNKFVTEIASFFAGFESAQAKIKEVSSNAAESAKQTVQNAYQEAVRIKLNVAIRAPIVIIPQHSRSRNALLADLGTLVLSNSFHFANSTTGQKVPIDQLLLNFAAIKLSRIVMNAKGQEILKEFALLSQPQAMEMTVLRNLSGMALPDTPSMAITGGLKSLEMQLSSADYGVIMAVLADNFGEPSLAIVTLPIVASPSSAPPTSQLRLPTLEHSQSRTRNFSTSKPNSTSPAMQRKAQPVPPVRVVNIKVDFSIGDISAKLYLTPLPAIRASDAQSPPKNLQPLCGAQVLTMEAQVQMYSDNTMTVLATLANITLDDLRSPAGELQGQQQPQRYRMLERKSTFAPSKSETSPDDAVSGKMFHMVMQQQANGDKTIDITIAHILANLSLSFYMGLLQFIAPEAQPEEKVAFDISELGTSVSPPSTDTMSTASAASRRSGLLEIADARLDSPGPPAVQSARPVNIMQVNVVLKEPEIVLIEDLTVADSRVLVLKTAAAFKMTVTPDETVMALSCLALQCFLSTYNQRHDLLKEILMPVDFGVQGKRPFGKEQRLAVTLGAVRLTISPVTVQTIMGVLAGMGSSSNDPLAIQEAQDYSDLWQLKPIEPKGLWFLNDDSGTEMLDMMVEQAIETVVDDVLSSGDQLSLDSDSVVIILESTVGQRTLPMVLAELKFNFMVDDFSRKLSASGMIQLEMTYYNEHMDVWEPLLEPVEEIKSYRSWQAQIEARKNFTADEHIQQLARVASSHVGAGSALARRDSEALSGTMSRSSSMQSSMGSEAATEVLKRTAAMTVSIASSDPLQLTIAKTTLDVLTKVADSFTSAISQTEQIKVLSFTAPYVIVNETGLDLTLAMTGTLRFAEPTEKSLQMAPGTSVDLFLAEATHQRVKSVSVIRTQEHLSRAPPSVRLNFGSSTSKSIDVIVSRAESRFYLLENVSDQSKPYRLIVEIKSEMGHKQVTLRSVMQVQNLLPTAMTLYVELTGKPRLELATVPAGHNYNLPMTIVQNSEVATLMWRPAEYGHLTSSEPLPVSHLIALAAETLLQQDKSMRCAVDKSQTGKFDHFYFTVFCKSSNVRYSNTHTFTPNSKLYQISLSPLYSILNFLPPPASLYIQMEDAMEEGVTLSPGSSASVCNAQSGQGQMNLALLDLQGAGSKPWVGAFLLNVLTEEILPVTMNCGGETLTLGIRHVKEQGTHFISIYSPVWIMNKTGLELAYKDPVTKPAAPSSTAQMPIMFGGRALTGKKRIAVKASGSEWSKYVSLDTVGSSGMLPCNRPDGSLAYEFGITIKSSATVLSRLLIVTPYYVFSNTSEVDLLISEEHPDARQVRLPAKSSLPFWPQYLSKYATVKVEGTAEATTPFSYSILQTLLLRLNNKYGGIYVQTQISDSNVTCILNTYKPGTASALLVNDTRRCDVQFRQEESSTPNACLPAGCTQLFTWPLPTSGSRSFVWTLGGEVNKPLDLNRDDAGLAYLGDGRAIYWISFLDGLQRVVLFTDRQSVAQQSSRSLENEMSSMEVELTLNAIGLSLVDNVAKKEVMYLGFVSPGPVWMGRKVGQTSRKAKAMAGDDARLLESAYQQYLRLKDSDKGRTALSKIITAGDVEVTFDTEGPKLMTKPKVREVQRLHQPGMWCRLTTSDHHTQFHLKLHKLQLDNPTLGTRYQVVLYPVPLPTSSEYKPFAETSVVIRKAENSAVVQYKLISFLIQEFQLQVDQAFINNMLQMFGSEAGSGQERSKLLESFRLNDLQEVGRSLQETVARGLGEERQAYYERLLLQPIKIHLSFSLNANSQQDKRAASAGSPADFITLFIKSIGVTISEANDVVFKLGTFQRDYRFFSQKQLVADAYNHYWTQVVKQMYILVFGLEILGNPFGLVRGITDGVKDLFYEPYMGLVEGPEEFMTGVSTGIKNFLGGTVGGTVGAVSRVTGTLGKAMAALSFDQDYQQQRQAELTANRSGGDFATGMMASGGHLLSGFVGGITGVVRRPMEGAKEEGVEGFFKGVGKGLVGLIARPATGIVDTLSGSLSTLERTVKGDSGAVQWLRTPRFIASDGVLRPYNQHQADGGLIFRRLKNGEYTKTDEYITHLVTSRDRRYILLLTNRRVFCLEKGDFVHDWNVEWVFPIDQMPDPPNIDEKGLCLYIEESEGDRGLFSKSKKSKRVFIEDRDAGTWFCTKVTALWRAAHPVKK